MSDLKRVGVTMWAGKAMEMFGRTHLNRVELFEIRELTKWAIPSIIWKNQVDGLKPIHWRIPQENAIPVVHGQHEETSDPAAEKINNQLSNRVPVDQLFLDLEDLVQIVAEGHRPSLLITGGSGTGKSYTVFKTLEDMGLEKGEDWILVKGKTTAYGVYRTLFLNRNRLIVYDDSDDVFAGQDTRNLLKSALDSYSERVLSWQSKMTIDVSGLHNEEREAKFQEIEEGLRSGDDQTKMPSEFEFTGRIIFISNLSLNKVEDAIISRSLTIDCTLSPVEIFDRIEAIADKINPEGIQMDRDQKMEVLTYLRDIHAKNPRRLVSLRDFVGAIAIKASGSPRWKELLSYV